ncbi:ABC transporter permease [Brachybacterium muris]|uniref:Uncharacterized protein n=1 Tax=Brachybacterium muris UCD-AY4 TaxID=1249481 RepID=A0A022L152_9MICO|nr:ABC transporter permease [Brachybacterium muris]EYT50981.1 hypothetical protein D641_0100440 [Brachybacterium muris UCD-AY4]
MRPDIDIRSYFDTRAGLVVVLISALAVAAIAVAGGLLQGGLLPDEAVDVELTVIAVSLPLSLIIPVIAVMMTAGEWSDRSIQVTLLQRPGRLRVLTSKLLSTLMVVGAIIAGSVLLSMATTWIGGSIGDGSDFASMDRVLTTQVTALLATLAFSVAMGVLTQSTVMGLLAAIGIPFVVSTSRQIAMLAGSETLDGVLRSVDLQAAAVAFGDGQAEAFDVLPLLILVVLPLALGAWRWSRREIG